MWYGPKFGNTRPPGLPPGARGTLPSKESRDLFQEMMEDPQVVTHITDTGGGYLYGAAVNLYRELCEHESGLLVGRPADSYDTRPLSVRPAKKKLITAWGIWQCNDPATRRLREGHKIGSHRIRPVEGQVGVRCGPVVALYTERDEILSGLLHYSDIIHTGRNAGLPWKKAIGLARIMHSGPAYAGAYIEGRVLESRSDYAERAERADTLGEQIVSLLKHQGFQPHP